MVSSSNPVCAESVATAVLSAWRDHMLPNGEWERIASHVPTCAVCQPRLRDYDQNARALMRQRELEPGERVVAGVREHARTRTCGLGARDPRRRLWGGLGGLAAVAAVILLFVSVLGPVFGPHPASRRLGITRIPLSDPSYGVLGAVAAPDGGPWFTEERFTARTAGSGTTNGPSKISHVAPNGKLAEYPLPTSGVIPLKLVSGPGGAVFFVENVSTSSGSTSGNDELGRIGPTGAITEYDVSARGGASFHLEAGSGNTLWLTSSPAQGQSGVSTIYRITAPER